MKKPLRSSPNTTKATAFTEPRPQGSSLQKAFRMRVPFAELRSALTETEGQWRPRLEASLTRASFVLGPEVAGFESEFAAAMGAKYVVGVSSGTAALELSLRASRMRPGADEVITTPLTAPFTAVAITNAGYQARFADIDPETLLMDPRDAANRVTAQTAAIVPVHLYGQPYDVAGLSSMLAGKPVEIIQDACQAHGARSDGTPLSSLSRFVSYSFYPTKNLGCLGDGGAIATDDPSEARRLSAMRNGGRGRNHVSLLPGVNARLDELQACFLRAFLPSLESWNERRRRQAGMYEELLAGCEGVRVVPHRPGSVYHLFVIRTDKRDQLRDFLSASGIDTAIHYPVPLHRHPAFRSAAHKRGSFPHAEKACREILSLPLRPQLADESILYVAEQVRLFFQASSSRRGAGG